MTRKIKIREYKLIMIMYDLFYIFYKPGELNEQ